MSNNIEFSAADNTREFREIDCGQSYISMSDNKSVTQLVKFSKELLDHRLALAEYKGRCETLIGNSNYKGSALAISLINDPRKKDHYHGIDNIAELCSGDISSLLEIYREIFEEGQADKNSNKIISNISQNKAIKKVSKRFFTTIGKYHPHGKEMQRICLSFGTLCRRILYEGKKIHPHGKEMPSITNRIEVDQKSEEFEEWSTEQEILMKELLRRSVFIELEPSRGRKTFGPTMRWQLRRIYCPTFGLAMMINVAVKWSVSEFKYFVIAPEEVCEREWKSRWSTSKHKKQDTTLYSFDEAMEHDKN